MQSSPPVSPPPAPPVIQQKTVKPVITYSLLGVTIFVFILQYISQMLTGYDLLFAYGGKINEFIFQGEFWRLITPVLLHGSLTHLAFNMYALFSLGSSLERHFGHSRFAALYLAGGFSGNVLSFLFSPNPSLGSSTAIFGLLAAEGVFIYQNRKFFGPDARRMLINTISIAVINFVFGLSVARIDNLGHLGGLLGGVLFTWIAGPAWAIEGIYPTFQLVDKRPVDRIWLGLAVSIGVFALGVLVKFLLPA